MSKPIPVFMTEEHAQFSEQELADLALEVPMTFTIDQWGMISGLIEGAAYDPEMDMTPDMRVHVLAVAARMDEQMEEFSERHEKERVS